MKVHCLVKSLKSYMICVAFSDEDGDETFETRREMVLNEDKREKFDAEKWGANLIKCEGNKIEVEVCV